MYETILIMEIFLNYFFPMRHKTQNHYNVVAFIFPKAVAKSNSYPVLCPVLKRIDRYHESQRD
jgi:hypothetical protein